MSLSCVSRLLLTGLIATLLPALSAAQSSTITYQGQLRENGNPVTDTVNLQFQLFDALSSGSSVAGPIQRLNWPVEDGLFQVELDFGADAFAGGERFLQVVVNGAPLSPRQRLTSVPFALRAGETVAGAVGSTEIDSSQVQLRITGTCPSGQYVQAINENGSVVCDIDGGASGEAGWSLTGNAGTDPNTNFIGSTDAQALEFRTDGARTLRLEPSDVLLNGVPITVNVIAGSSANEVLDGVRGATIAGGGLPAGDPDPDFAFDNPNRVTDHYGSIGGGYGNRTGNDNADGSDAAFNTVGGGVSNVASGRSTTVSGGEENSASSSGSTVGGGIRNNGVGTDSTVGGGIANTASGSRSTVSGGVENQSDGTGSTIGGGAANEASNLYATVSGGFQNTASADGSIVVGWRILGEGSSRS